MKIRYALGALAVLFVSCGSPERAAGPVPVQRGAVEIPAAHFDVSEPLRDLARAARPSSGPVRIHRTFPIPRPDSGMATVGGPVEPTPLTSLLMPATLTNFDGVGQGFSGPAGTFTVNSAPPDTVGDVGPNHYVQMVNADLAVFSKTGTVLFGPVPTNTLWAGFGGACQTDNDGDGIVLYDPIADRWILAQFAVTTGGATGPFFYCVAVSKTPDPTGAYNRYSFSYTGFPDYPKFGVWRDAYYVSYVMFNAAGTAFLGPKVCALDRTKMLAGLAATQQCFDQPTTVGVILPADLDGATLPPSGSEEPMLALGGAANSLDYFKFHVDFATPANSTLSGPTALATAAFAMACAGGNCIPQPGTGVKLDSLADRLMHRLAYRNFGSHESLVVNHAVTGGTALSGIRWYELRLDGSHNASIFQQGTYSPDANSRWMGSIAMDGVGDIAVGFSLGSATVKPQIHYSGRLASDAAGQLTQGEATIVAGGGSQTGGLIRWGDYSAMTVDPVDDCTFWYTNEYIPANGSFNWKTRIASFKFPSCGQLADFSIAAAPASRKVAPGGSAPYTITTAVVGTAGAADTVTFSASGLPTGVTAAFVPASAVAGTGSTLTLTVGGATLPGSSVVTVTGTGSANTHSTTVTLQVDAAPVAVADSFTVLENGTLSITAPGVLSNDTDAESDPLTAATATGPAHGALTLNANGSFTYTPNAGYFGPDSFTYTANDGLRASSAATVSIRVDAPPIAVADSFTVLKDGVLTVTAPGLLGNDTDADADPLLAAVASAPTHGTLVLGTNGGFVYTPTAGYSGPDTFTYTATDGFAVSGAATVSITVDAPPVAADDAYSVNENATLTVVAPGVLVNDSDPDATPLTASVVAAPTHGTLSLGTNGAFTYTPTPGYFGPDSFLYAASDGFASANATAAITVVRLNQPPVAVDDAYSLNEDGSLSVAAPGVLGNDSDPDADPITATLVSGVTHGALSLAADGSFTYTPVPLFHGTDSFTYQAFDGSLASPTAATVTLTVVHVNHPPVAQGENFSTEIDTTLHVLAARSVLLNDTDVDGDVLTAVLDAPPAHGTLTLASNGSFSWAPDPDFSGNDSFGYHAFDGAASSPIVPVTLKVGGVDSPPNVPVAVAPVFAQHLVAAVQHFEWKPSSDTDTSDTMTYRLRVLKDGAVVADKTTTSLTLDLSAATALLPGRYLWQIEASDSIGTASGPSAPIAFFVDGSGGGGGCGCSTTRDAPSGAFASAIALLALLIRRRTGR